MIWTKRQLTSWIFSGHSSPTLKMSTSKNCLSQEWKLQIWSSRLRINFKPWFSWALKRETLISITYMPISTSMYWTQMINTTNTSIKWSRYNRWIRPSRITSIRTILIKTLTNRDFFWWGELIQSSERLSLQTDNFAIYWAIHKTK